MNIKAKTILQLLSNSKKFSLNASNTCTVSASANGQAARLVVWRAATARHCALRPARGWRGALPPAVALNAALRLHNDTHAEVTDYRLVIRTIYLDMFDPNADLYNNI